ncbi:DNA ligase [Aeromonas phage D9]|nr:DNA ligase [Aeromonas phage D9]
MEVMQELTKLEALIAYHDHMFFEEDRPIISDSSYDLLVARRKELMEKVPDYKPGHVPGFVQSTSLLQTVKFHEPMLSVDKHKTGESIKAWAAKQLAPLGFSDEEKLDGVALRAIYEYGVITDLHLRGDGEGTSVIHRLPIMTDIQTVISEFMTEPRVEVTGEAYVTFKDLNEYADQWNIESAESRSTVNGMLKRLVPEESDTLPIRFKAFHASENIRSKFKSYLELREYLKSVGFDVPVLISEEEIESMFDMTRKPVGEYAIDGIVRKNNDLSQWNDRHMSGYWTYAACYKYPTNISQTTLLDVIWSINTKGYLEGTVLYEPVKYDGSIIQRARFNYPEQYIAAGLAKGSIIEVTKANEIIPYMVGMLNAGDGEKIKYPEHCPICEDLVEREAPAMYRCVNENCPGAFLTRAERLVSPKGLNVASLGPKRLLRLIDSGYFNEPADLFNLKHHHFDNLQFDNGVADKVIRSLEKAKGIGLNNWLYAACIPELGFTRATELANQFGKRYTKLDNFMETMQNGEYLRSLFNSKDGLVMAAWVEKNHDELYNFLDKYDWDSCKVQDGDLVPIGITGSWNYTRDEMKALLAEEGFFLDSISKGVKAVLVGEKPSPSKVKKVEKWNIPLIKLDKLMTFDMLIAILKGEGNVTSWSPSSKVKGNTI